VGSRGLEKGPEHRGYFVSASALYDLASASILISTKAGFIHVMAELPRPGRAPISSMHWKWVGLTPPKGRNTSTGQQWQARLPPPSKGAPGPLDAAAAPAADDFLRLSVVENEDQGAAGDFRATRTVIYA
jgi:hypothetical protein